MCLRNLYIPRIMRAVDHEPEASHVTLQIAQIFCSASDKCQNFFFKSRGGPPNHTIVRELSIYFLLFVTFLRFFHVEESR
jgi:hypothetical protein